jgi:hypothetical protein
MILFKRGCNVSQEKHQFKASEINPNVKNSHGGVQSKPER